MRFDLQMHAARTGHQNFAESTEEIKPLTEEEKKAQLEKYVRNKNEKSVAKKTINILWYLLCRVQAKIVERREERAGKEKQVQYSSVFLLKKQ